MGDDVGDPELEGPLGVGVKVLEGGKGLEGDMGGVKVSLCLLLEYSVRYVSYQGN